MKGHASSTNSIRLPSRRSRSSSSASVAWRWARTWRIKLRSVGSVMRHYIAAGRSSSQAASARPSTQSSRGSNPCTDCGRRTVGHSSDLPVLRGAVIAHSHQERPHRQRLSRHHAGLATFDRKCLQRRKIGLRIPRIGDHAHLHLHVGAFEIDTDIAAAPGSRRNGHADCRAAPGR
jgi:hypothetical protein